MIVSILMDNPNSYTLKNGHILKENLSCYVCEIDTKGIIKFINKTYQGHNPDEVVGTNLTDWIPKDYHNKISSSIYKVFSTLHPEQIEYTIPNSQGELRSYMAEITPVVINGQAERALIIAIDNTEQIQIRDAQLTHFHFLENLDSLNKVISQSDDLASMLSNALKTVRSIFQSDRASLLFPCDPDADSFSVPMEQTLPEWPGALALNKINPINSEVAQSFKKALNSNEPIVEGLDNIPDLLKKYSVQSRIFMAINPSIGKPWLFGLHQCSYARVWSDEEKRLFKEIGRRISDGLNSMLLLKNLQESENKFRSLYQTMPDGVAMHELLFNEKGVPVDYIIIDVNQAYLVHTGISYETAVGKKASQLYGSGEPPYFDIYKKVAISGEVCQFETYFAPMQKYFQIAVCSPAKGKFATIFKDITLIKNIEKDLRQAKEEAENATDLKDKFISIVAHDLKGPAVYITGLLDIFLKNNGSILQEEQKKFISAASNGARKMNRFIEEILNMSRIKKGKLKPKFHNINPFILASNAINILENKFTQKEVRVVNKIPEDKTIYSDGLLLEQVIDNLLTNAVKFSNKGGTVTIYIPDGEPFTIAVSDTGIGIPHSRHKDIFDFEKITSTIGTAGETGTGLGLPFCYEIMKALGGELTFESVDGKGSIFFAKLPDTKPKILIVADEEIFWFDQKHHLNKLNLEIMEAVNAEEASSNLKLNKIDLIVTEVKMPPAAMNGMELLKRVKDNPATEHIPVIVVTELMGMEIRNEAFENRADDFLQKPFDPNELIIRVKRFL